MSVTQAGPTTSSSSAANPGLLMATKRRGVTPLVTLSKRSGHISAKSRSTVSFSSVECSAATPLTAWLPTVARCAMRSRRSPPSSIIDMRTTRASSPGKRWRTSSRKRRLISWMISIGRGSMLANSGRPQVSSASGSSVWLV